MTQNIELEDAFGVIVKEVYEDNGPIPAERIINSLLGLIVQKCQDCNKPKGRLLLIDCKKTSCALNSVGPYVWARAVQLREMAQGPAPDPEPGPG